MDTQFSDQKSILDTILSKENLEEMSQFEPSSILRLLFANLSDKEKKVIIHRYGLEEEEVKTLEEIGHLFNVTRERIRQIENSSIKKMKGSPEIEKHLKPIESLVNTILEQSGGVMRDDNLLDRVIGYSVAKDINRAATKFIIFQLLNHNWERVEKHDKLHDGWKLPTADLKLVEELVDNLVEILTDENKPLPRQFLLDALAKKPIAQKYSDFIKEEIVDNALDLTHKIDKNPFEEWGLLNWRSITPKRMNDKIYLVMKKEGKPMHFTEIATKINDAKFDDKTAYPATIHNELILDDKYVLVGRGIYALKEWGYQPGVVADVIAEVLQEAGRPLTKNEIMEKVLLKRIVKKSTIQLALMNKDRFVRVERNKYELKK